MKIDKVKAEAILHDIIEMAEIISRKHGLKPAKSRLKYGEMVEVSLAFELEGGLTKDELNYNRYAKALQLPPLGSKFIHNGEECITKGLRIGGPFKSLIYDRGGKLYRNDVYKMLGSLGAPDAKLIAAFAPKHPHFGRSKS